jgi:hypothetical protein
MHAWRGSLIEFVVAVVWPRYDYASSQRPREMEIARIAMAAHYRLGPVIARTRPFG